MSSVGRGLFVASLFAGALALGSPSVAAHELPGTTARVTVRDGHVEVRVEVDPVSWLARAGGETGEDVPFLAQVDPERLEALRRKARAELGEGLVLRVDGRAVRPAAVRFPGEEVVRRAALRALVDRAGRTHGAPEHLQIVVEARTDAAPTRVELALPASMGPVQVEIVAPRTRVAPAGAAVAFDLSGGRP